MHRQALELENGVQETSRSVVSSVSLEQHRLVQQFGGDFFINHANELALPSLEFVICQCRDDDGVGSASRSTLLRAVSLKILCN